MVDATRTRARYEAAVGALVERLQEDRQVLAVVLCGSLSHDQVWEKSDVDLVVVVGDDLKDRASLTLDADGINVHAYMVPRKQFTAIVNGTLQGSFLHSLLSYGRVLAAKDPAIVEHFATMRQVGSRDRELVMLRSATTIFPSLDKAEKWLFAKDDPVYCFFWLMKLLDNIAFLEVIRHGEVPGREVIRQARAHNPGLINDLYDDLIAGPKSRNRMEAALARIREYLLECKEAFAPIYEYLREADGPRGASEIGHEFNRRFGVEFIDLTLEWMAAQGLVHRVSVPTRLFPKARVTFEEVAYTL